MYECVWMSALTLLGWLYWLYVSYTYVIYIYCITHLHSCDWVVHRVLHYRLVNWIPFLKFVSDSPEWICWVVFAICTTHVNTARKPPALWFLFCVLMTYVFAPFSWMINFCLKLHAVFTCHSFIQLVSLLFSDSLFHIVSSLRLWLSQLYYCY